MILEELEYRFRLQTHIADLKTTEARPGEGFRPYCGQNQKNS